MTDFTADALVATAYAEEGREDAAAAFGHFERRNGMRATLVVLNILMLLALAAFLWSPAVIFYAALILTPVTLAVIVAITQGIGV